MAPLLWRIMAVDKTLTGSPATKSEKQSNESHYEKTSVGIRVKERER